MDKRVKTKELFSSVPAFLLPLFEGAEYPWQMLPRIKEYAWALIERGIEGYHEIAEGVLVGEGVRIHPTATVEPPAILGAHSELRPGAFIRGSVITGEGCVIGNSTELKNCILLDGVQVPHYNNVGDSVLGHHAHMGAGAVYSNLKSGGGAVTVHGDTDHETGLRKLGGILADGADIGCGAVVNPGTVVGKNTSVYPLTALRGVYPANCIVKATDTVVKRK